MKLRFIALTLSGFLVAACSDNKADRTLPISAVFASKVLTCQNTFVHRNKQWRYQNLQLFVSNFSIEDEQGNWQPLQLASNAFQNNNIALIGESCAQISTNSDKQNNSNWLIEFANSYSFNKVKAIKFTLGVPFEHNHLNPLTQPSPLNVSSMFWVWQTGHKFARIELSSSDNDWIFHLGSTGCAAPSAMRPPQKTCKYPNQVEVTVTTPATFNHLYVDLGKLVAGVDLMSNTGCQSNHQEPACKKPMSNIGALSSHSRSSIFTAN